MAVTKQIVGSRAYYSALSTDSKPLEASNGSELVELDTGKFFYWSEEWDGWSERVPTKSEGIELPAIRHLLESIDYKLGEMLPK